MTSDFDTAAQDIDADEDEPSWTDFFLPLALLAIAVVPFTPLWDQVADPDRHGRYGAIARFLDSVGPVPVALTFGALGLILLVAEIRGRSRSGA